MRGYFGSSSREKYITVEKALDINAVHKAVKMDCIEWSRHGLERMVERDISRFQTKQAILEGVVIEEYADDYPCPSALFLGWSEERPIHVVVALNKAKSVVSIITVYEPTLERFEPDFRTRKRL